MPHTYIDRSWSSEKIFKTVNDNIKQKNPQASEILPLSEIVQQKKLKLLGHIIRSDEKDPVAQITFSKKNHCDY